MIPVGGLLAVMPKSDVVVTTYGPQTRNAQGHVLDGVETEHQETLAVHPATSRRMLERLKEADRERETIALYAPSTSALLREEGSSTPTVTYKGASYTVAALGDYDEQGGVYLVLAQRTNQ